jgi:hypothetical protein
MDWGAFIVLQLRMEKRATTFDEVFRDNFELHLSEQNVVNNLSSFQSGGSSAVAFRFSRIRKEVASVGPSKS